MAVFMPIFVLQKYPSDDGQSHVGQLAITMILIAQPATAMLTAPIIGAKIKNFGRKNMLTLSMVTMTCATMIAGCASFTDSA